MGFARHSNFRMQAPAGDLRAIGTDGWWAPATPDPARSRDSAWATRMVGSTHGEIGARVV